jgi:hypothetical protein
MKICWPDAVSLRSQFAGNQLFRPTLHLDVQTFSNPYSLQNTMIKKLKGKVKACLSVYRLMKG